MAAVHARLSPSGAHRWMLCPGSVSLEAQVEDNGKASEYAAEGTAAHTLAEQCLRGGVNADDYFNETIEGFKVDQIMADAVQQYIDYVRDQKGVAMFEERVCFDNWVPEAFGTCDAIVLNGDRATVIDLKYGKGVRVDAKDNVQAMCYALGVMQEFGFLYGINEFKIVICQPRLDHITEWTISAKDLETWADHTLAHAAHQALLDDPLFNPGEKQCQFCKAKGFCRALAEDSLNTALDGFSSIDEPFEPLDINCLYNDDIAELLPKLDLINSWTKAVMARAISELEAGRNLVGYKLVHGKSNREWIDEEKAIAALARKIGMANAVTKKIIGITAAEKQLGKDSLIIKKYTHKPEGSPTIAPSSDPRPAIVVDATDGFDSVE